VADYLPPVVAKLTGDDSGLARTLAASKDRIRRWAVDVGKTKVTLTVDAKLKEGTFAELRRRVVESPAAKVKVELALATGQSEEIRRRLAESEVQVKVKPVMDPLALRRVQTILRELGKRIDVSIRPAVDDASQRRALTRLNRLSQNRTVTIRTRVIGGGTPAGGNAASDVGALSTLISLAPALVPIAAAATSVAASVGAATVAVGAFGLAAKSQIASLGGAADAQKKYTDAVTKYGPHSQQAAAAQDAMAKSLDGMPAATQRASVAFLRLKDDFKSWSDGLAEFTMEPVTRGFAVAEQILPKLTPMVKGTSAQLDRLVTIAGGAVSTPGFDALAKRLAAFANGTVKRATDDVIHFTRVLSEGGASGPVSAFMRYAKEQGPAVREALENIAKAAANIIKGASQAGPGMLSLVNAVAKLVAALPPEFIGRAMQLYTAFRLIKLTNSGITSVSGSLTDLTTRLTALRAASVAAGGGLAGARAAIASLSTGAKAAGAIAAVAGLALVLKHFSDEGKKANISSDEMAASLKGIASGDRGSLSKLLQQLTKDSGNLHMSLGQKLKSNDSVYDIITNSGAKTSSAKKDFTELGSALADMVKAGDADKAAQVLDKIRAAGQKVPTSYLKDYKSALADVAFEAKMTAQSQGLFGRQAQDVQKKLDAQKRSVQGLQQAILDLNDTNRAALDADSAYQQSVADTAAMVKGHEHALKMDNGELDLHTTLAREAYDALSRMAAKTEATSVATLAQTGSQDAANRKLIEGHAQLVRFAEKMNLSTTDATKFADTLDNINDPKIQITVKKDQAEANLASAKQKVDAFPKWTRTVGNFSYEKAASEMQRWQRQVDLLNGKTVVVNLVTVNRNVGGGRLGPGGGYASADGSLIAGHVRRMASGGMGRPAMMARGGSNILWGEGGDESYIPHDRRPRSRSIAERTVAIMGGTVSWDGSAAKGATAVGGHVAAGLTQGLAAGQSGVTAAAAGMGRAVIAAFSTELGIASPSRRFRSLGAYVISGLVQGLTGSTASVKAATKRVASTLYVDFGSSHRGLQQYVAREDKLLVRLAGQRDSAAGKLKAAQARLASLQKSWVDERNSVASGIMQNASIITASPDQDRNVNANDVLVQMQQRVQAAVQFSAELEELRKKGLRSDLIQQLASAGVDQAGATAQALAGGTQGQIQAMNKMQASLASAANATGAAVATAMYGAGIRSAQGLVKGLQSQERAIEAQMMRIALAMQKAIKKALGIRSPSTVMARLGDHTARGMAVGIDRSAKHAVIAARGMAMAVQQGATITGGGLGRGGGGTVVNNVYVTVQGSVAAERKLVDTIESALDRRAGRNPGGFRPTNPWNSRG